LGYWKGKSAFLYHRQIQTFNNDSQSRNDKNVIQNLWAKGHYQKIITSATDYENDIYYVNNNSKKHGLAPLSSFSTKNIAALKNISECKVLPIL
jgi:hypothetical protein